MVVTIDLDALVPIDDSNVAKCLAMNPASDAYQKECSAGLSAHIDVDEDTIFTMTPDLLWVDDVDSFEAIEMMKTMSLRHYSCADVLSLEGCFCGQACVCGGGMCKCEQPAACDTDVLTPGELIVEMRVGRGKLSISPPPGRNMVPVKFLRNTSNTYPSVHECLLGLNPSVPLVAQLPLCYETCPNQQACAINASLLLFQTTTDNLQTILRQKYLTYVGNENVYGFDQLNVWVADQGFTDEWYNLKKAYAEGAEKTLQVYPHACDSPGQFLLLLIVHLPRNPSVRLLLSCLCTDSAHRCKRRTSRGDPRLRD